MKIKQRLFSLLLCAAMFVSLCVPAAAEGTGTYLSWDDEQKTLVEKNIPASITEVTNVTTELNDTTNDGWYIVHDSVDIGGRVKVSGDVHLILKNGCALAVTGSINVGEGNSLTIYAQSTDVNIMGKLTARLSATEEHADIGGNGGQVCGDITINGGTIEAHGGDGSNGAGIGSGGSSIGGSMADSGNVTIRGGNITASSSQGMAISGGTVTATGTSSTSYVYGIDGPFDTGTDGSAFIAASSIKDNSAEKKEQWSGVIFEGDSGKVYGSEITLGTDATIPAGKALEIEESQTLIVGEDVTLTNYGTITGSGTIINNGTIKGNAAGGNVVTHSRKAEWSSDDGQHWHPCTVADCTAHKFDTAVHTPSDWIVDREATSSAAGSRHKACTVCGYVTATEAIPATGGNRGGGDYTPPTYKPEVSKPGEGGEAPATSPANPSRGDTVTVTPRPDEGYEVEKITVTDRNGRDVEVTKKPDGTYTFTQPAGTVTIDVTYVPLAALPWENPFGDVSEGDWYYEAVRFVQENGLMTGYEDGRFGPNDNLSRAQLAQILFNKEDRPVVNFLMQFDDVTGEAWYAEAVRWAASLGIVSGFGNGTFGPDAAITREQLAVMLWRYAGSPETGRDAEFADMAQVSDYALEAVDWARANGIVQGRDGNRFDPQGQATRAETAAMLMRYLSK